MCDPVTTSAPWGDTWRLCTHPRPLKSLPGGVGVCVRPQCPTAVTPEGLIPPSFTELSTISPWSPTPHARQRPICVTAARPATMRGQHRVFIHAPASGRVCCFHCLDAMLRRSPCPLPRGWPGPAVGRSVLFPESMHQGCPPQHAGVRWPLMLCVTAGQRCHTAPDHASLPLPIPACRLVPAPFLEVPVCVFGPLHAGLSFLTDSRWIFAGPSCCRPGPPGPSPDTALPEWLTRPCHPQLHVLSPLVPLCLAQELLCCGNELVLLFAPLQGEDSFRILVGTEGDSIPLMEVSASEVSRCSEASCAWPLPPLRPWPCPPRPCTCPISPSSRPRPLSRGTTSLWLTTAPRGAPGVSASSRGSWKTSRGRASVIRWAGTGAWGQELWVLGGSWGAVWRGGPWPCACVFPCGPTPRLRKTKRKCSLGSKLTAGSSTCTACSSWSPRVQPPEWSRPGPPSSQPPPGERPAQSQAWGSPAHHVPGPGMRGSQAWPRVSGLQLLYLRKGTMTALPLGVF